MSLILNIDTASENAHVSFAKDGDILHVLYNETQKEHASFLQAAILQLTKLIPVKLSTIDAVAVTAGPGSYTGLRVGFASAKGLCYALKKPLITLGSLDVLAASAVELLPNIDKNYLLCPMIDARRMEVFTAVFAKDLTLKLDPCAMILDENSFEKELTQNRVIFFGNGSEKWKNIANHPNASFEKVTLQANTLSFQSNLHYINNYFTELAYSEPFYLKEFQSVIKK